jgi:tetratricopeptide (TPR) repeat protein
MMRKLLLSAILLLPPACAALASAGEESYLHFMNGLVLERKGNYDTALQEYRRTLALDPQSVFVHKQALNLALRVGKVAEAEGWADFVVKADSATSDNWVLYGNVKWSKGDAVAAAAAYEKALALDADNSEALYQLASLWSSKSPDKAVGYLKKYLEVKPDDAAEVYYQMAVLYNMKNDYENMRKALTASKEADSMYVQPRYMLANYYEMKSDTAAALAEYGELMSMDTKNLELYDHVGELYSSPAVSDLASAEKYFLKAAALQKDDPRACFWLSVINEQRRDFAAAASWLEASSGLKSDSGLVLRLAYYYTQSGRYPKAISMLEDASRKWPDNTEIMYFLALGYDDTGKTAKALKMLKDLLKKAPDNAEARMQYGVISERENDLPAAEESFRYLLAKNPANANVLNYLGYALADRGVKLDEAEVLISSAVALDPANGAYLDSLAWVKFKRGDAPAAKTAIKKAVKSVYDDPVVWGHAGDIYEASGDLRTAWLAWKTAWLLEAPARRKNAAARIKALQKKIPDAQAEELEKVFLKTFSPGGQEFSSFAKVEAKLRGKTVKFDAILHFSPPADFSVTVMGPLMAPIWKARVSGGILDLDAVSIKGLDPETFNYWASLIAGELDAWFDGEAVSAGTLAGGWDADCLAGGGREVCLDDSLSWPEEIKPAAEKKLTFKPGNYFLNNLFLFPQTLDFKMPFVSVRMTLDRTQMKFAGTNVLTLPD